MIAQVMHLPHLLSLRDRYEVVALCDLSPGTVQAVGERYHVPFTTTDFHQMLDQVDLDAVMVLTRDHFQPAVAAARAGKHIFVEKPMCNNLEEADELVDVVAANDLIGMVGYHKRFDPGYVHGCQLIQQLDSPTLIRLHDVIGPNSAFLEHYDIIRIDDLGADRIHQLQQDHEKSIRKAIGERSSAVMRAYNLMLGLSTHDMCILHGAFGLPEKVLSCEIWSGGTSIAALLQYQQDLRCVFTTGIMPGLRKFDESLTVYAPNKVVSIVFPSPFLKNAPTIVEEWAMDGDVYRESQTVASYQEAFQQELIHFHECVVERKTPRTPLSEGREDIAFLIEMARAFQG